MKAFVYVVIAAVVLVVASPFVVSLVSTFAQTQSPALPAPSFNAIQLHYYEMTEAKWQEYADELVGKVAKDWRGKVLDVRGKPSTGYELWLDMDPKASEYELQIAMFPIGDDVALSIERNRWVTFSGRIKDVNRSMNGGPDVQLTNAVISDNSWYP